MPAFDPHSPVGLVAILHPGAVPVLQALGVDLALEHDRSFADACAMRDRSAADVYSRFAPKPKTASTLIDNLGSREDVWVPAAYL